MRNEQDAGIGVFNTRSVECRMDQQGMAIMACPERTHLSGQVISELLQSNGQDERTFASCATIPWIL
jgi:hypothetical protein